MVVFVGIAVLCLGAVIARYLREKKCQSGECPQPEPGPDTLKITVSYYPPPGAPASQASQISEEVIQELHTAFVKSIVSVYTLIMLDQDVDYYHDAELRCTKVEDSTDSA